MHPPDPDMEALLGSVVADRIQLEELIGSGSSGTVFRGHHKTLSKSVAVKVLRRTPDGDLMQHAFAREARTAAKLDHPNIVNILDFGDDGPGGAAYIAMEFLEGRDLAKILEAEGRMDGRRLATLMVQATAAVAAAHIEGIVHRDLKPANLMILERRDDDGEIVEHVKVCDFGLAKIVGLNSSKSRETGPSTLTAAVVGTPAYMSPEQAVGEALDERTDIYALGIVMYELLTGDPPFASESFVGLLTQHVTKIPKSLRSLEPSIPPTLESIVMRCLEKDRENRFSTARELRQALQEFLREADVITKDVPSNAESIEESVEALPMDAILGSGSLARVADTIALGQVEAFPPTAALPMPVTGTGDLELLIAEAVDDVREEIKQESIRHEPDLDPFQAAILEELNAGKTTGSIDRRNYAAAVSERAQYIWRHYGIRFEAHEGPDTYWVTDHRDTVLGPLAYGDAMKILYQEAAKRNEDRVQLSGDGKRWMSAAEFVTLTGQELMLSDIDHDRAQETAEGRLATTSPAALLGRIARESLTGRFYFERENFDGTERVGLHVVNGAPTFVYSSEPELQLPRLLVTKGVLSATVVPVLIHRALAEGQPLGVLIARDTGIDLGLYRAVFMKERLASVFLWSGTGTFTFVPGVGQDELPFAGSVLAVLTDIIYRTMSFAQLSEKLHVHWEKRLKRSERFVSGVRQMGLTRAQLKIAKAFGPSRTLGDILNGCTLAEQPLYYTMAYALLESDLLLRPIG